MKKILCKVISVSLIVANLSVLSACENNGGPGLFTKTNVGTVIGGAGGAIAGSTIGKGKGNIAAIAVGTLLGAGLGHEVGASLDRADKMYYERTSQSSLENNKTGVAASWNNPDSGNNGTITPTKTFKASDGSYCREYTQTIIIQGKASEGYGTACRQPDGSWQIRQ